MSAFHLVVRPRPLDLAPPQNLVAVYRLLDLLVEGVSLTARIGEGQVLAFLADLGHATAHLASGRRTRLAVPLYSEEDVWELGIEVDGPDALITIYRSGPAPEVTTYERPVRLAALRDGVLKSLDEAVASKPSGSALAALAGSLRALSSGPPLACGARVVRRSALVSPDPTQGYGLAAQGYFRQATVASGGPAAEALLERADLHSLLICGNLRLVAHGHTAELGRQYLFLVAEQLVLLAEEVLVAWRRGRPLFRRIECGEARFAVRRGTADSPVALTVSSPSLRSEPRGSTFPAIPAPTLVRMVANFAKALVQVLVEHDPAQAINLRLSGLRRFASRLEDEIQDSLAEDSVTNPDPDNYRSFASTLARNEPRGQWEHRGKMRFLPRWVATVPGIDLTATFLCGEQIVLGAARETACLHRTTGEVLWRVATQRAACVATPLGLARIHPDGRVSIHELQTGEIRFTSATEPRSASRLAGTVICTPGLPRLLVLAEGDRRLTAIDLVNGEVRWRFTGRRPTAYRLRRAGRLLLVAADTVLMALDAATGEVVWRMRDRVPFSGDIALDRDGAFAVQGVHPSEGKLVHLDLWSGTLRWTAELTEGWVPGQPPLTAGNTVAVPARDRRGSGAQAFDRASGRLVWLKSPGLVSPMATWLAVDDCLVVNSAGGSFLCLDAPTGCIRYSQVFCRQVDAEQPRRLEPVLRSGALFVPQHQVHVIRPGDGELLGTVPTDLIPDLLRVDERCDVYVVEESGQVAAFGAAPRLTLVS